MHQGLHTLDQLPIGDTGVIHQVGGQRPVARRLMEMGLLPGTRIEAVGRAPLGDPLEIRLRGYLFSLRQADAAHIQLLPDDRADLAEADGRDAPCRLPAHESPARADPGPGQTARIPRVLVAGNANAGKTTVFNALTGARAHISNYPGVTVTRASRRITLPNGAPVEIVDLPGTYSLTAHSPDEQVAVDGVLGRYDDPPDAVVVVVDAGVIERALYLVLQIAETGIPVVVALNMMDEAEAAGAEFDADRLGRWLGAKVVPTVASKGAGLDALRDAIGAAATLAPRADSTWTGLPPQVEQDVSAVTRALADADFGRTPAVRRSWALWSLLSLDTDDGATSGLPAPVRETVHTVRRAAAAAQRSVDQEIISARYRWIEAVADDVRTVRHQDTRTWTKRIDDVLTHRFYGMAVFAVVMAVVFEALFTWSEPFIGGIETATGWLQNGVTAVLPAGNLADLLVDGVIAGVGNVVVFVPQIAMLSLFIALLEDFGYLARVAFVIDRLMGRVGLHGKAFVPMLSGFACAIPAVMATRTIEGRRDRLITMLTLPMISCSARLPVYALVTAVVFAGAPRVLGILSAGAVVLFSMYALSVVATLGAAAVLRRTVLRGPRLPLLLELPPYRRPVWSNVFLVTWRRTRKFLEDAGTVILTMTIILWALLSFPHSSDIETRYDEARAGILASTTDAAAQRSATGRAGGAACRRAAPLQHRGPGGPADRAGDRAPRLRLAHRGRHHRRLRGARGLRLDPGHRVRHRGGRRGERQPARVAAAGGARGRIAADDPARRRLADGVLRAGLPVHEHDRRRAPGVGKLGLAGLHVRLHVGPGLRRVAGGVPGRLGAELGRLIAPSRAAGRAGGGEGLHSTGAAYGFATTRGSRTTGDPP